jgi:tetratricopeptide (TPR) repeat protein
VIAATLLALSLAATDPSASPAERFEAAGRSYLAGDFEAAARAYQELLAEGWESPALHLDLGNARYRLGRRGAAIAAYLRALRLDPGDADARANLELLRAENVDQVMGAAARPLALRAAERVPDGGALVVFGLAWLGLWGALAARRFAASARRGLLGLAAGTAALVSVLGGAVLAGKAAARSTTLAVVVAAAAPVREGPEAALRSSFELHEGTEVRVLEIRGDAVRVRLGNGLEGWVAATDLEQV